MIKCALCEATVSDTESAIAAGWYPSFYAGDDEFFAPVCMACVCSKMVPGDPDIVLRPDVALPDDIARS